METLILGTAGHIDHGKTALIKALTGVDTDRLAQEKERGISIELGFASLEMPGDLLIGIVDVPGHEKLVRTMVAGATGMDMVLLVVAADDGIMPQTLEHLAIIDLLGVRRGIIAVTKTDLVEPDWVEMVREEIDGATAGTAIADSPIIPVSARTGQGMNELRAALEKVAWTVQRESRDLPFRMPIDRVFTLPGAGTVVTGSAWDGILHLEDKVRLEPGGRTSKARSLEVHGEKMSEAKAGERVAVNIGGLSVDDVRRGQWLVADDFPGRASKRHLVELRLLPDARPLKNRAAVRFSHGTKEAIGRIVLPDAEELEPGGRALAVLILNEPVLALYGDGYIIRQYSPMRTIGGGRILIPALLNARRHDVRRQAVAEALLDGDRKGAAQAALEHSSDPLDRGEISRITGLVGPDLEYALESQSEWSKTIVAEGRPYIIKRGEQKKVRTGILSCLEELHKKDPSAVGTNRQTLFAGVAPHLPEPVFNHILADLVRDGFIKQEGSTYSHPEAGRSAAGSDEEMRRSVLEALEEAAFQTPSESELMRQLNVGLPVLRRVLGKLVADNEVVRVAGDLLFTARRLAQAEGIIREYITAGGGVTPAQFRELVGTSRKYAVPLLEHFDKKGLTRRQGDFRVLA